MATIAVLTAFVIVVAITAAAALALVSAGIRREERDFTLTRQAPDRVSRGTRLLTGLYVRDVTPEAVFERETTLA